MVQSKANNHSITSIIRVAQTPHTRDKDEDDRNLLLCPPPVKACTLIEPSVRVGNAKYPVPISKVEPPVSRLTSFPEIITPAAPGGMRTPSTTATEVDSTSTSKPSMLRSDGNVGWGMVESRIVLDPIIKVPEGWTLMTVPCTVTAGPPAEMVVPAIVTAEESEFIVNVWPASAYVLPSGGRRLVVELPIANAPDAPRLMTVPLIVRAGPPADIVVPAMEIEEGFGVKV